ncbi:hypothetical protein ALI144C_03270 [Actinosynnema sp. ALI-1.44]|nr:hypothetical protein ALI144C_03270 [Actinosynnema sp. ALI-1.44]
MAELVNTWVHQHRRRTVELTTNYIGKIERGVVRWPNKDYRDGLCAVLKVDTCAELGLYRNRRTTTTFENMDRKNFLLTTIGISISAATTPLALTELITPSEPTAVPSIIGQTEIAEIRTAASLFSSWDHTYGGSLVREAVAAQLRYAVGLLNAQCPAHLRSELHSAVGYLGNTAAFMAFDAYAHDDARKMFSLALACAEAGDDWHLRARVLTRMARQAIWCDDAENGLTLVEFAMVRADRLTPAERAMLLSVRARALAKLERVQDTITAVGMSDEEFGNIIRANESPFMNYYDSAHHSGDTGHALWDLAIHGRFAGEARSRLTAAYTGQDDKHPRSRALNGINLAQLVMSTGDPLEAAQIGCRAMTHMDKVRSPRLAHYMRELWTSAADHKRLDEVAELRDRIGDLIATH